MKYQKFLELAFVAGRTATIHIEKIRPVMAFIFIELVLESKPLKKAIQF